MLIVFDLDGTLMFRFGGEPTLRAGAAETFEALFAAGFVLAVLSNAPEADVVDALKALGVYELFEIVSGASEGREQKPDAGPLLEICDHLGFAAGDTMMIGDSEDDRLCAEAAGAAFIGISGYDPALAAAAMIERLDDLISLLECEPCLT
jgi:phosphoglycolate phosphatase